MIRRLVTFDRPPNDSDDSLFSDEETIVVVPPAIVARLGEGDAERIRDAKAVTFVHSEGQLSEESAAAALSADLFAAGSDTFIELGSQIRPGVVKGMLRRIGRRAVPFLIERDGLSAEELVNSGLADVFVERGRDTEEWLDSWIGRRSLGAVAMTARLLHGSGGDDAERASFSQIFDDGEVGEGLRAFLDRRPAEFDRELIRERR